MAFVVSPLVNSAIFRAKGGGGLSAPTLQRLDLP